MPNPREKDSNEIYHISSYTNVGIFMVMMVIPHLVHSPGDRHVPRGILTPEPHRAHRPRTTFRVRIRDESDVAKARKVGLPLHMITPEVTAAWGFPHTSENWLVVAKSLIGLVDTPLPIIPLESEEAARRPGLEDLIVVLLKRDPLLGRSLALRHHKFIDLDRLLKRLLQEDLEEPATLVGLQELVPALPKVGMTLPRSALERQDRNAWVAARL